MKKALTSGIVIVGILSFVVFYQVTKKEYQKKVEKTDLSRLGFDGSSVQYASQISSYFPYSDFNLPNDLAVIAKKRYIKGVDQNSFFQLFFNDPLNKEGGTVLYVPLYDRLTNKKEAFILISAGIDGVLNSAYNHSDTIYEKDFLKKFSFYNQSQYVERKSMKFNLWEYLFGKKDYLVWYYNCYERNKYYKSVTLDIYNKRKMKLQPLQNISIKGHLLNDTIKSGNRILTLSSGGLKAHCMLHRHNNEMLTKGDTIAITGYFEKISEDGTYHIGHCLIGELNRDSLLLAQQKRLQQIFK